MPDLEKTFKVGNKVYNIPVSEVDGFKQRKPEAQEIVSFKKGSDIIEKRLFKQHTF